MTDPTPEAAASRTIARMLGRNSRLPGRVRASSRACITFWKSIKCDCGHASLVPGCHAPACPYRTFWEAAAPEGPLPPLPSTPSPD